MRIESSGHIPPTRKVAASAPLEQAAQKPQAAAGEPVELSENVYLFKAISQALEQTPEVRGDRVQAVKEKLGNGQYQVDSKHMARLILEAVEDSRGSYRAAA